MSVFGVVLVRMQENRDQNNSEYGHFLRSALHLSGENLCDSMQAVPFDLNLRIEKWLVISIYSPPSQNSEYFLNKFTKAIDFFADTYDNYLIMGDFNIERSDPSLKGFLNSNNLYNLINSNTCFNGKCSCIDLFLTNKKIFI